MFVCLTNRCAADCIHCPEKFWLSANNFRPVQNMSLELFQKVIDILLEGGSNIHIGICGGEILLYPNLDEVLNIAYQRAVKFSLYTSLMGDTNLLEYVANKYENGIAKWHINIDFVKEKYELFNTNYWKIINVSDHILECTLRPGEESVQEEIQRIDLVLGSILNENKPVININISKPTMYAEKFDEDYTESVETLVRTITEKYPGAYFDINQCLSFCELNREKLAIVPHLHIKHMSSYCTCSEEIVLPDASVRYCFAMPEILVPDIIGLREGARLQDIKKDFISEKLKSAIFKKKCRECEYFNPARCFSPCLALQHI